MTGILIPNTAMTGITADENRDGITYTGASDTLPKEMLANAPTIERLRQRFDEARSNPNGNTEKCNTDRDYYDGPKQLNSEVRTVLKNRMQPPIYTNRVRPAVNGVLGVLEAGRRDPRGLPRNPDDEGGADVATKTLRYINDESKFNDTQMDVAENFFIEGTGAVIIEMLDGKIVPTQIRWEEFYADPYARRADFKDARYMGIAKWTDADVIRQKYRVRIEEIGDPLSPQGFGFVDSYQDRPLSMGWVDIKRRRIMQVEEYALEEGEWKRIVYIASGVLEYGPSPYLDDKNRPCNPIEAESCYIDRENSRYGMVRDMVPIQDEINASRSRSLHLMNSRQVQNTDPNAPPVDDAIVRAEASKADGVMPMGWQIVSTAEQTNANLMRMQEAKGEIERMGPTPAVLGRQEGAGQSGRARLVSQQAGLTELARPMGRLHSWVLRCYEQMWNRARQFWTDPMWIRVTDEVKSIEFLKVNEPELGMVMQPAAGPDGQPVIDPNTGQPQMAPAVGVTGYKNRLSELNMDIILDQNEDTATLQQEVWAEIMELLRLGMSPFSPEFEMAVEMSPLADKPRILERLKAKREEMEKGQAEQQQMLAQQQQRAMAVAEAKEVAAIEKTEAETTKTTADAHKIATDADLAQVQLYSQLGLDPMLALAPEPGAEQEAPMEQQEPVAPPIDNGYQNTVTPQQGEMPPPGTTGV